MAPRLRDLVTRNLTLKLVALVLAVLLWAVVRADSPTRVSLPNVPVEVALRDQTWTLVGPPSPATVTVIVSAPYRAMVRLAVGRARIIVPVETVSDTTEVVVLEPRWVRLNGGADGLRIEDVRPGSVRLNFDRTETRTVPVAPLIVGRLPDGLEMAAPPAVDPPVARLTGAVRRIAQVDTLRTDPVPLDAVRENRGFTVPLDTAGLAGVEVVPQDVRVTIRVRRVAPEPEPIDTPAPEPTDTPGASAPQPSDGAPPPE